MSLACQRASKESMKSSGRVDRRRLARPALSETSVAKNDQSRCYMQYRPELPTEIVPDILVDHLDSVIECLIDAQQPFNGLIDSTRPTPCIAMLDLRICVIPNEHFLDRKLTYGWYVS